MSAPAVEYSEFKYSIRLPLVPRSPSPEWLGRKFLATLDALTRIDSSIFPDWEVGDLPALKGYPLAVARPRIAEIIGQTANFDDFDNPEGPLNVAVAHTTIDAKPRRMTVWAGQVGNVWLNTGDYKVAPDPAIVIYPLFKAALLAMTAIWQPQWACAQVFRSAHIKEPTEHAGYTLVRMPMIPTDPTFPISNFHIPWFAHLSAPLAAGVRLPPEIRTEHTTNGGFLMTATEDRLDPLNPEHLRRARILAETLIAQFGPHGETEQ